MRKYYTRPCNFYYGGHAKNLITKKKKITLAGNSNISFDQLEIFTRKSKKIIKSDLISINKIKKLNEPVANIVKNDLEKIILKRKKIAGLNFNIPQIMGVLNVTPDSFSDGGLYFKEIKALNQAKLMIKSGASVIDIGGESTRPGSQTINELQEWKRVKNILIKFKKQFPKITLSLDTRKS